MTIIKKSGQQGELESSNTADVSVNGAVAWEIVWHFFKKLCTELPYDPEIPFVGVYQRVFHKKTCITKIWKKHYS